MAALAALIVCSAMAHAQAQTGSSIYSGIKDSTWQKLFRIEYQILENYDEFGDLTIPVFTEEVKALAGERIKLPGYIFPFGEMSTASEHLMFTALPVNACFFCGVGGPESVVEVFLESPAAYSDGRLFVEGTLELNDQNPEQMMYILRDAKILKN